MKLPKYRAWDKIQKSIKRCKKVQKGIKRIHYVMGRAKLKD